MPDSTPEEIDHFLKVAGQTFVWHALCVPNVEDGVKFYTEALGMGTQTMDMGAGGSYTMLTSQGIPVCGVHSTKAPGAVEGAAPHWAAYLSVDDVDARLTKCEAAGGKVVVPAFDIPTVGRMALVSDSQGAHIWIFKPNPRQG